MSSVAAPVPDLPAAVPPAPVLATRTKRTASTIVLVVLTLLGALFVLGSTAFELGLARMLSAAGLALVPFGAVVAFYVWLDRWEPHPRGAILTALGWGAFVATAVALLASAVTMWFLPLQLQIAVQAPVVEEVVKAVGIVVVARRWREEFHSLVDGLVIAGLVGAGFAFVENILYFGQGMLMDSRVGTGGSVTMLFVLRGIVSPFAHSLFASTTGLGVAHAERVRGSGGWWAAGAGLVVAIGLHALWNVSGVLLGPGFLIVYVVLMVPLFVGAKVLATVLRRREGVRATEVLRDYTRGGWLAPWEPGVVTSMKERRRHHAWATSLGSPADEADRWMADLIRLAHLRERVHRATSLPDDPGLEARLLDSIRRTRPGGPHVGTRAR